MEGNLNLFGNCRLAKKEKTPVSEINSTQCHYQCVVCIHKQIISRNNEIRTKKNREIRELVHRFF